ncbi:adhesion G-protein coupled receptor F3 [Eucyclogobius newberryi]|uniref:adhesion G-protein coupled receptor F3 n=1 Tax=Eucyclogobius newberryi TaxID=166745 RepID=UPI003B5AC6BD
MWFLPLLCVLGVGFVQGQAKGKSTQMHYVTLSIDAAVFQNVSKSLLDFTYSNKSTFTLDNLKKTKECDAANNCKCSEGFDRSEKTTEFSCVSNETGVVRLSAPKGPLDFESSETLICTSSSTLNSTPHWSLKNYKDETKPIVNGTESSINKIHSGSKLKLSRLTLNWKGTYNCSFIQTKGKLVIYHTATANLDVCVEPKITIRTDPGFPRCDLPSDLPQVTVFCQVKEVHEEFQVTWLKENNVSASVTLEKNFVESGMKIFSAQTFVACSSGKPELTCRLKNKCDQKTSATTKVVLIRENTKICPKEGIWQDTPVGERAVIRCSGSVGTRERPCNGDGKENGNWGDKISHCVDEGLSNILDDAINSNIGLGFVEKNAEVVFSRLQEATGHTNVVNSPSNLNASVKVIDTMSDKLERIDDRKLVEDFLQSSSNLLNVSLKSSWKSPVQDEKNRTLAEKYLHSVQELIKKANLKSQMKTNLQVVNCNTSETQCSNSVFKNNTVTMNTNGASFIKTAGYMQLIDYLPHTDNSSSPNSIVVSTTLQSGNKAGDITDKIKIKIKFALTLPRPRNTELKCVFWDTDSSKWSGNGCRLIGYADDGVCECDHLSAFSILMSKAPLDVPYLNEITYAGLSVSIVSLIICLVVELILWNDVVKTDTLHSRHCAHVNISLCLLVGDVCFLASSLPDEPSDVWSKTFVLVQHFCYLSMFFWMLCLSSILLHKTVYVSLHGISKMAYLRFSVIVGYVCPLLIVAITFISNSGHEGQYYSEETRWLVYSGVLKGSIFTFILPVGIIVFINVFFMCLVIMKLLQPIKAQQMLCDKEKNSAKTVIRSVILLTPVFGLTWGLGFLMILMDLTEGKPAYAVNYLFTLMNAFQGLYIFLTTCVGDRMVRESLQRYFRKKSKASEERICQSVSSVSSSSIVSQSSIKK